MLSHKDIVIQNVFTVLLTVVMISVSLCVGTVTADALTIGPAEVELSVPADGSTSIVFIVRGFSGDLQISLEDIPLTIEPALVHVESTGNYSLIELTVYGNESLDNGVFNGNILFLAQLEGSVTYGIKVKASVNHIFNSHPVKEVSSVGGTSAVNASLLWAAAFGLLVSLAGAVLFWERRNGNT